MRCSSGRSALLADSPASTNSATIRAPIASALWALACRWAGIENPSSWPPFCALLLGRDPQVGDGRREIARGGAGGGVRDRACGGGGRHGRFIGGDCAELFGVRAGHR